MQAQRYGKWIILWCVTKSEYDDNGDEDEVIQARFKDASRAAEYALRNKCDSVRMELVSPDWGIATED